MVPCRYQDSQRNEGADRARRPDVFGIVSLTSLVLKKKPLVDDDMDNQIKPFLVTHALWRATRMGITDSNDATGNRNIVFFETSRTASLCRNSGRRQSCAQMGRDRSREGPGELVRPQSTSTQCPSMRERISHTQSTEFMRISRWPSRWLNKSKRAVHLRLHGTGSNMMVHAEVWRTTKGNNKAVVMVEFVVDTLVI